MYSVILLGSKAITYQKCFSKPGMSCSQCIARMYCYLTIYDDWEK